MDAKPSCFTFFFVGLFDALLRLACFLVRNSCGGLRISSRHCRLNCLPGTYDVFLGWLRPGPTRYCLLDAYMSPRV